MRAQITSGSTKVLASPTLILSENSDEINSDSGGSSSLSGDNFLGGISTNNLVKSIGRPRANESAVVVGERIITGYKVQAGQNGAANSCQPEFGIAGLTFGARLSKIDDNGFVTFSLSPTISAAGRQEFIQGCGNIALLTLRSLDTGSARVRDGQTLILTGVISDRDLQLATKWPVLGDLPVVGQFFRNSTNGRHETRACCHGHPPNHQRHGRRDLRLRLRTINARHPPVHESLTLLRHARLHDSAVAPNTFPVPLPLLG